MIPDLVQAIYTHYTLEDVQTFIERQNKKTEVQGNRAEIHVFGPFVHQSADSQIVDFKVYINLTFVSDRNVYSWTQFAQRYVDRANTPLRFGDYCLTLREIRVIYKGGQDFLEFCSVEISYQFDTGDTYPLED